MNRKLAMKTLALIVFSSAAVGAMTLQSAVAGCDITVKASYKTEIEDPATGKRFPKVRLDLTQSEVRAKPGTWKKMQNMCSPNQPVIGYGNDVAVSCELNLACGKRQFKFKYYEVNDNGDEVNSAMSSFPSGSDWLDLDTTKTVNVGDIGTKF
jgi:hypothetical protein